MDKSIVKVGALTVGGYALGFMGVAIAPQILLASGFLIAISEIKETLTQEDEN